MTSSPTGRGDFESVDVGEAEAHVWLLRDHEMASLADVAEDWLSAEELARADRLRSADKASMFRRSHAFVRWVLSQHAEVEPLEWSIEVSERGRPELAPHHEDLGLRFNLSHTAGLVGVVVTRESDCGIDVENLEGVEDPLRLMSRVFAPSERAQVEGAVAAERRRLFYVFWTLKESYIKARGLGLAVPLREFAFDLASTRPCVSFSERIDDRSDAWQFWSWPESSRHHVSVAVRSPVELQVVVHDRPGVRSA